MTRGAEPFALIVCGSPRKHGVSARYASQLAKELEAAGEAVRVWRVADHRVGGCIGCEGCRGGSFSCVIGDDMQELYALLAEARRVELVAPVYFAGPTAQMKAVLDRLQPLWERRRGPKALPGAAAEPKRPVRLHVIGAGGDPFGFAPLETIVRSSFGAAGFAVVEVADRVGWGQPRAEQQKEIFAKMPDETARGTSPEDSAACGAHDERTCS